MIIAVASGKGGTGLPYTDRSLDDSAVFKSELDEAGREAVKYFIKKRLSKDG